MHRFGFHLALALCVTQPLGAGPFAPLSELSGDPMVPVWLAGFRPVTSLAVLPEGDGRSSLIALSHADNRVTVIGEPGNHSSFRLLSENVKGPAAVSSMDANGDGREDVIVSSRWNRNLTLFTRNESGDFDAGFVIATDVDTAVSLVAADLNQDGFTDLVGATDNDRTVFWMRRLASGGFADIATLATLPAPASSLKNARLNDDNVQDLAVLAGGVIHVFRNDGTPALTRIASCGSGLTSFAVTDPEGGDGDLVAASSSLGVCQMWRNEGNGQLSTSQTLTSSLGACELVSIADLDGDMLPDLCFVSHAQDEAYWMKGRDGMVFAPRVSALSLASGPGSVLVHDFDGDAATDLAVASSYGAELSYSAGLASDPYAYWCDDQGSDPIANPPAGDLNQDGVSNLVAFASRLSLAEPRKYLVPGTGEDAGLPVSLIDGEKNFAFEFLRRRGGRARGITYTVMESSDLMVWTPADLGSAQVTLLDADWEKVRYSPRPRSEGHVFVRLHLVYTTQ